MMILMKPLHINSDVPALPGTETVSDECVFKSGPMLMYHPDNGFAHYMAILSDLLITSSCYIFWIV